MTVLNDVAWFLGSVFAAVGAFLASPPGMTLSFVGIFAGTWYAVISIQRHYRR